MLFDDCICDAVGNDRTDRLGYGPEQVSLDYSTAAGPTKFMVGTEAGAVLSCNRKGKTPADRVGTSYCGALLFLRYISILQPCWLQICRHKTFPLRA